MLIFLYFSSNDRAATTRFTGQIDSTSNNATISSNTISSSQTNSKFGKLATTTSTTTTTTTTTSATITVNTKVSKTIYSIYSWLQNKNRKKLLHSTVIISNFVI